MSILIKDAEMPERCEMFEVLYKRFLTYVVCFICEFANENGMSPNKTLEAVANDILSMIKIGDFDEWKWK